MALTRWPDLFAAGATLAGMSDLRTFFAGTEPWMAAASVTEYGDPVADREMLAALSPMTDLDRLTAPVLLAHGDRDTNVPVAESVQAHQELQALGAPSELLLLPGEGHTDRGPGPPRRTAASASPPGSTAGCEPEPSGLFAGYPASPADEAVAPDGRLRDGLRAAGARPWSGWGRGPDRRRRRASPPSAAAAG